MQSLFNLNTACNTTTVTVQSVIMSDNTSDAHCMHIRGLHRVIRVGDLASYGVTVELLGIFRIQIKILCLLLNYQSDLKIARLSKVRHTF